MTALLQELYDRVTGGQSVMLVTVVARSGSAPRGAGARMLVDADGQMSGTVGGGAMEHEARQAAVNMLEQGTSELWVLAVSCDGDEKDEPVCGGAVSLFFQYFRGGDETSATQIGHLIRMLERGEDGYLVLTVTGPERGRMELIARAEEPERCDRLDILQPDSALYTGEDGQTRYAERLAGAGMVYVFGAGHVSRELVPLLAHVGFSCVVLDDRPEFADRALFPAARDVVCTGFDRVLRHAPVDAGDYAVVMTRGHRYDLDVVRQLLPSSAAYIGMLGSRHKREYVLGRLKEEGATDGDLARIVTPIGMDIGGETPAEIAVSIAAQLIRTRADRKKT